MSLTEEIRIGVRTAPNRLMFGPHETNLGDGRMLSARHVAYYRRRAAGGAGVIVTEEASVHDSDWPYERAPLAARCGEGWTAIADAVHAEGDGALALAAVGHSGGQGSSAYSQQPLLAPSRVPEVNSREVPKWMEAADVAAVVDGFAAAARTARRAGMDGVEVNAGQHSLVRQFLSGLTNHRDDAWGTDRTAFARAVLAAVRAAMDAVEPGGVLGLRLSADELAPWAGITPEAAVELAAELAPLVDYLVVVRGSIFSVSATRPDMHVPETFNRDLCAQVRAGLRAAGIEVPVVLQGSVVDPAAADAALADRVCDLVEMTRAQIADPALGAKVRAGAAATVRPCMRCNQLCQVRDARNPIVSCILEPSSGHELDDPSPVPDQTGAPTAATVTTGGSGTPRAVTVVGGGPAGLEAARVAAELGATVRLVERDATLGGSLARAAHASGRDGFAGALRWWAAELARLGVEIVFGAEATAASLHDDAAAGTAVILAPGSLDGVPDHVIDPDAAVHVVSAARWLAGGEDAPSPAGPVVVLDPIGGPIGVSVAETLAAAGTTVHLVTQDHIAANELARTGDLAPANVRLQQAGVAIERRAVVRRIRATPGDAQPVAVEVEDRFGAGTRAIAAALVVDAGFRLPDTALSDALDAADPECHGSAVAVAGDAVAPRTVHEAVLEARRAVVAVLASPERPPVPAAVGEPR